MQSTKILVSGHVQGVCFRQTTKDIADQMKLQGTVRNLPTGDVEIVVHCSTAEAKNMLERVAKALPAGEITSYTAHSIEDTRPPLGFSIIK